MMMMNKSVFFLAAVGLMVLSFHLMGGKQEQEVHINGNVSKYGQITEEFMGQWRAFKANYGKVYASLEEEEYRLKIFFENFNYIETNQGDTWSLEVNGFADLTAEEFSHMYLGLHRVERAHNDEIVGSPITPGSLNWATKSGNPAIQNQGQCGSCWAFSATEAIESSYIIFKGDSTLLSEEQLVQCSSPQGNLGCNGGLMEWAFDYVKAHPLNTAANYPYTSGNGVTGTCNNSAAAGGTYTIAGYNTVPEKDCGALQAAIGKQPVSVAVDASSWSFYSSGTLKCKGKTNLNHGVLAIGYSFTSTNVGYWYVQNSWSASWGQNGYIQVDVTGDCGICEDASYPYL